MYCFWLVTPLSRFKRQGAIPPIPKSLLWGKPVGQARLQAASREEAEGQRREQNALHAHTGGDATLVRQRRLGGLGPSSVKLAQQLAPGGRLCADGLPLAFPLKLAQQVCQVLRLHRLGQQGHDLVHVLIQTPMCIEVPQQHHKQS